MGRLQTSSTMGPLQLPLSLPIGGWPTPSIPPAGGGTEYGSSGPALKGTRWQRELRQQSSPPFEFTSPRKLKRPHTGTFFKPAAVSHSNSFLSATSQSSATARLPGAPSTGSISYRPSEFMSATAPCRKPPRLKTSYPSPRYHPTPPRAPTSNQSLARRHMQTREQREAMHYNLREDMRRVRQQKQRRSEISAYRFIYRLADINKNGSVDPAEVLTLMKSAGHGATVEGGFWRAFEQMDIDKSNNLDFDEFTAVLDHMRGARDKAYVESLQSSDNLATNGDGDTVLPPVPAQRSPMRATLLGQDVTGTGADPAKTSGSRQDAAASHRSSAELNGTAFLSEATEFQRQLLDVYCAIGSIREGTMKYMIAEPEEDSRVRTEAGRAILNQPQRIVPQNPAEVKTDSFEELVDLSITAVGGISNQRGAKLQQKRRQLEKDNELSLTRKAQLAVRSTYASNMHEQIQERYGTIAPDAMPVLEDFVSLFEDYSDKREF